MNFDRLLPDLQAALKRGDVVTLMVQVPGDIERARAAGRLLSLKLRGALGATDLHLSRSATPGLAAMALCRRSGIGIDVEHVRPAWIDDELCDLALHPAERATAARGGPEAFFGIWTRKEAVLKALGVGLSVPPSSFDSGQIDTRWAHCKLGPIAAANVRSVHAPCGYSAAFGAIGFKPTLHSWVLDSPICR